VKNREPAVEPLPIEREFERFRAVYESLRASVSRVIVGHEDVIEQVLLSLVAGGHALLEGVPGIGKTLLVRTLASSLDLSFARIQFTPDLMPADILGTNVMLDTPDGGREFEFREGPIFGQIVLADEINRATPKTQSALLEAMEEHSVTVSRTTYPLPEPFFVLATQNPIEMEGTYPLPEAQLDRFVFKIAVGPPEVDELETILDRTTGEQGAEPGAVADGETILGMRRLARRVVVPEPLRKSIAQAVIATHPGKGEAVDLAKRYVRYGSSPRGAQAIVLTAKVRAASRGRLNVSREDVKAVAHAALRHRVLLSFEGEAEGLDPDRVIDEILRRGP
jgi:MoxR-like ATPase